VPPAPVSLADAASQLGIRLVELARANREDEEGSPVDHALRYPEHDLSVIALGSGTREQQPCGEH
jgi:hypothetical protein